MKYSRSKSDPKVYPLTCKLEREAERLDFSPSVIKAVEVLLETFGEYEHGTADVEDIDHRLTLKIMAEVYSDMLLCLAHAD